MSVVGLSISDILKIITHIKKWVTNLLRAKEKRKEQSKDALEAVILAVRETKFYLSSLQRNGERSIENERELMLLWTELSFKARKIKLKELADRCNDLGKYWANPSDYSKDFLNIAGNRLSDIERIAENILDQIY